MPGPAPCHGEGAGKMAGKMAGKRRGKPRIGVSRKHQVTGWPGEENTCRKSRPYRDGPTWVLWSFGNETSAWQLEIPYIYIIYTIHIYIHYIYIHHYIYTLYIYIIYIDVCVCVRINGGFHGKIIYTCWIYHCHAWPLEGRSECRMQCPSFPAPLCKRILLCNPLPKNQHPTETLG